jgi:hypothetical protein
VCPIERKGVLNEICTLSYIHRRLLQRDYSDYYLSITCVCPFESTIIILQNSERTDGSTGAKPLLSPLDGHESSSRG